MVHNEPYHMAYDDDENNNDECPHRFIPFIPCFDMLYLTGDRHHQYFKAGGRSLLHRVSAVELTNYFQMKACSPILSE